MFNQGPPFDALVAITEVLGPIIGYLISRRIYIKRERHLLSELRREHDDLEQQRDEALTKYEEVSRLNALLIAQADNAD